MNGQNNDQQLAALPRRSRRLATMIPASHWISMGYSEDDAYIMEDLQNDIKKYCDNSGDEIYLVHYGNLGNDVPLSHHDLMIPHWKRLFKAIHGRTSVEEFDIGGICMPISVLDIMFPALQSMNLDCLYLCTMGLENDGFQLLSSFIKHNSSVTRLVLEGNKFDDVPTAATFSNAVKDHPNLEMLSFYNCSLSSNIDFLRKILEGCKRKNRLGLVISLDSFGTEAISVMADYISSNHLLRSINLSGNNIKDSGAAQLATALKTNTNMHGLHLYDNDITEDGESCLRKVLFDPTSIDSIVQSNHRSRVYTYDNDDSDNSIIAHRPPLEKEILRINKEEYTIGQKIRKKVVLALCGPNRELFDLAFLNGLPLELMPRMLELIQEYGRTRTEAFRFMLPDGREDGILEEIDRYIGPWPSSKQLEKGALSRLFHTLRGWELPLLFVNLSTPSSNVTTGKRKRRKTSRH